MTAKKGEREGERDMIIPDGIKSDAPEESVCTNGKNVYQRFLAAMRIIDGMPWAKDLSNTQYKSIPIDTMRAGVRKACITAGLVHTGPCELSIERERTGEKMTRFHATCTFVYTSIDDPSDTIVFESAGEAMDSGDKGTGKVITNLIKNHYKAAFDIGEQSKDDIDAYSNEELYAEAERIEANRRRMRAQVQGDSFFSAKRETKPPSADRDPAQMKKSILTMIKDTDHPEISQRFLQFRERFGLMSSWTEAQICECYDALVAMAREASA